MYIYKGTLYNSRNQELLPPKSDDSWLVYENISQVFHIRHPE